MYSPFDKIETMGLEEWGEFFKNNSMMRRWNERMGTVQTVHLGKQGDRLITTQIPTRLPYRLTADRQHIEVDSVFAEMSRREQTLAIFPR